MANIKLTKGERYTFERINGSDVITFGSDYAHETRIIRNSLYVSGSSSDVHVIQGETLTLKTGVGAGTPALRIEPIADNADSYIRFDSNGIDQSYAIGIDTSNESFVISSRALGTATVGTGEALHISASTNRVGIGYNDTATTLTQALNVSGDIAITDFPSVSASLAAQIAASGEPNQNAFSVVNVSGNNITSAEAADTLILKAGPNITLRADNTNTALEISASGGGGNADTVTVSSVQLESFRLH